MTNAFVNMTGWVGSDVEYRLTSRFQTPTATFRLACTPRINRNGQWQDAETTWLAVTCYRGLADNVKASVKIGDPVLVVGQLRTQSWLDKDDVQQERHVLQASSVGHDLQKGTSSFSRTERVLNEDTGEDLVELILDAERNAQSGESTETTETSESSSA
ncbi:MAG: single-stranded DNA-binding protein [Propionibacteriaceae bacterium]